MDSVTVATADVVVAPEAADVVVVKTPHPPTMAPLTPHPHLTAMPLTKPNTPPLVILLQTCCSPAFPVSQARTIPSTLRLLRLASLARVKLMEATTLTLRPNARYSTSVPLTVSEVWANTPSSAPTVPSSTRTTSSVTGGSTLTVPRPRTFTARMTR